MQACQCKRHLSLHGERVEKTYPLIAIVFPHDKTHAAHGVPLGKQLRKTKQAFSCLTSIFYSYGKIPQGGIKC